MVIYMRPGRQRALRRLYSDFVAPGDLVFDIGAHLGDRTRAFRDLGCRVIALEPQPVLFSWLERIARRGPEVTALCLAAGARTGEAELAISAATPTVSSMAGEWRAAVSAGNPGFRRVQWERTTSVPVTTLDALIAEHGVPRFCKIDVEGYEGQVLAGLGEPIAAVSVEFVAGALPIARACVERLCQLGTYRFNVIPGEGRRFRWPAWREPEQMLDWLDTGAEGFASGDLYARLVEDRSPNACTEREP